MTINALNAQVRDQGQMSLLALRPLAVCLSPAHHGVLLVLCSPLQSVYPQASGTSGCSRPVCLRAGGFFLSCEKQLIFSKTIE
jgi:hypothetical protein